LNLVIGTLELTTIGGVGTYLLTVAEQLERLGHSVTIYTEEAGEMASIGHDRGLRVVTALDDLPEACDAIYAQDAPSAYALSARYRRVPQAFCLHATEHDRWAVPQLPGVISTTVVLHDRAERHARAFAHAPEVIRLRQPADTRRFSPRGSISQTPRRALLLGNYVSGNRFDVIAKVCAATGIELVRRGLQGGGMTVVPEVEMNEVDFVIGKSRVIVEAMCCGRAAYVFDHNGADGWVTAQRYPELEADNFDGLADVSPREAETIRTDLAGYRASMGVTNRDLAVAHHDARSHCESLLELFERLVPRTEPDSAPLDELARLTRLQWRADARALGFEHEARLLRAELARRNEETIQLQREAELARQRTRRIEQRLAILTRPLASLRSWRAGR
jgi:hypothetical protein